MHKVVSKNSKAPTPVRKKKPPMGSGGSMSRSGSGGALSSMGAAKRTPGSRTPRTPGGGRAIEKPRGAAAPIQPATISAPEAARLAMIPREDALDEIRAFVLVASGGRPGGGAGMRAPHTASTSKQRMGAAGDVAVCVATLGPRATLIPAGISQKMGEALRSTGRNAVPPPGREGALFILRALCEQCGAPAEPHVVPLLPSILLECGHGSGAVRDAAEDAARALVTLAHPRAIMPLILPALYRVLGRRETDWRTKHAALRLLVQLAAREPAIIGRALPKIVPSVSAQVWDTKQQVVRAAHDALLACCLCNNNTDVAPAVPAVVNAIMKPTETVAALEKLMGTTFVSAVDSSTLAVLCPILSRGLKEKMALNKRMASIVIENMSRLVNRPGDVAPFGPLLVPELRRVVENVQFEDMRDVAMGALKTLTQALGHASVEAAVAAAMTQEAEELAKEQAAIEAERAENDKIEEDRRVQEEEEKRQWKEAMDAQRELDRLAEIEQKEKVEAENLVKELAKTTVKGKTGKCQGCGLKKCKKGCLFS